MKHAFAAAAALIAIAPAAMAEEDHEHPELMGSVKAFHDVMKVDWHADASPERNARACANVGDYITLARGVGAQAGPDHASAEAWSTTADALVDASVALGAYCATGYDGNVVSGLSTLHDRFHDVMDLVKEED